MRSNLEKFVGRQTTGKLFLVATHLWLEHVLTLMVHTLLPNPGALFRSQRLTFLFLVSLCEAHGVISTELAKSLVLVNQFRNKCAHQMAYLPDDTEFEPLLQSLKEFEAISGANLEITDASSYTDLFEAVATALESRARSIGVPKIDADSVIPPSDWELEYYGERSDSSA